MWQVETHSRENGLELNLWLRLRVAELLVINLRIAPPNYGVIDDVVFWHDFTGFLIEIFARNIKKKIFRKPCRSYYLFQIVLTTLFSMNTFLNKEHGGLYFPL